MAIEGKEHPMAPVALAIDIPSETALGLQVQMRIVQAAQDHGYDEPTCFAIRLAIEEALVNAMKHGNVLVEGGQRVKDSDGNDVADPRRRVRIYAYIDELRVQVEVENERQEINEGWEEHIPDPTLPENLEKSSGRGRFLMRHYAMRVDENEVRVRLVWRKGKSEKERSNLEEEWELDRRTVQPCNTSDAVREALEAMSTDTAGRVRASLSLPAGTSASALSESVLQ